MKLYQERKNEMNFNIETKTLLNAVNNVSKVIDKLSVLPALSNLKIVTEEKSIIITGSNGTASMQQTLPMETGVDECGQCLVDAKYFSEIIRKVSGQTVEVDCTDNLMHIKCGKAKFKLTCTDVSEYPGIDLETPENRLNCPMETLRIAFEKALVCVAINGKVAQRRPVLTGVNLSVDGGKVAICGSDSYRASRYTFTDMDCKDADITIPAHACIEFLKAFKDDVAVYYNDKKIQFQASNMMYQSRLLNGEFPSLERIIPKDCAYCVEVDKNELLEAIKRCDFVKSDGEQIIHLAFNHEESHIDSKSSEIGETYEELETVELLADPIEFNLNGKYLMDALDSINSEKAQIKTPGEGKPLIVRGSKDSLKLMNVLVPVKTYK